MANPKGNWNSINKGNDEFTGCGESLYEATPACRRDLWKIMTDPYLPRNVSERGSTFMTRAKNLLYFLHPISMLTARLLPSPLRPKHENLVSSNELIKIESPAWKIWKADFSSNSHSSERIDEGLKLWQRANIRNASFPNLSRSVVIRP